VGPADVAAAIGDSPLLLVLDNCEHVAEACRLLVATLDSHAPHVRVLATSRVTLHAPGEYVVRLQPLPVPGVTTDLAHAERQASVRAFVEHVRRHRSGFRLEDDDVAPLVDVLRQLDGLPLAIELVAGQAAMMPIAAVRDRLGRALDLHTGVSGAEDGRQRTLRRTIEWSYRLLDEPERALLRSIAPFPAGVDLARVESLARESVPGHDPLLLLRRLVEASLVVVDESRTRYRLLFTVRAFLLDELAGRGELEEAERRFLFWALETAHEVGRDLVGPGEPTADRRLRAELANFRAARDLARRRGDFETVVEITVALNQGAIWRDLREIWAWSFELAEDPDLAGHRREAEVLAGASDAARLTGDFEQCVDWAERGLALDLPSDESWLTARCWSSLATVAHFRGDFFRASELWSHAGSVEVPERAAGQYASSALAAAYAGELARARPLLAKARELDEAHPSVGARSFNDYVQGELVAVEDPAAAIPAYVRAIEGARSVGANFVEGVASVALASARTRTGEHAAAAEVFGHLLGYWYATGHHPQLWTTARNAVPLLLAHGHTHEAALLLLQADSAPNAASVDEQIARHSGRSFTSIHDLVGPEALDELRAEATRRSGGEVIELARTALARITTDS
jgi:predicted ATPase